MGGELEIRVLGALEVARRGRVIELPPSKKARGLLSYLALTGRGHTRARLCELFWDVADDPRGGLRWCLSRLRGAVDGSGRPVIVADRTGVAVDPALVHVDVRAVRARCADGLRAVATDELHELARSFRGELLEELDFSDLHALQAWLVAERSEARRLHAAILRVLVERLAENPTEALSHARLLVHLEPHGDAERASLVRLLLAVGERAEAEQQYEAGMQELSIRGLSPHALRIAWRQASTAARRPTVAREQVGQGEPALIGRAAELDGLCQVLQAALGGQPAIVTLGGEPGVGKSRLLRELAREADSRGVRVLHGNCVSAEGAPPYLPFVEALDAAASQLSVADLGGAAPLLARILPGVAQQVEPAQSADRYAVFRAVASLLCRLAAPSGLLLAIEDLHWADHQSLLLLGQLARHAGSARLLLVCTFRDDEVQHAALAETLSALRREPLHRRVALRRLSHDDARALISTLAAETGLSVEAILVRTEGLPLFIMETVKHLLDESASGATLEQLPDGVREAIERRLSRLRDDCRRLLSLASAFRGPIAWPLLVAIAGGDEERLLDLLDEALAARVIRERQEDRTGSYEFTHALIRQALYDGQNAPRRARLHRMIGDTIERVYAAEIERHLPDLAHHFFNAASISPLAKVVDYVTRAGDQAARIMAFEEAEVLYRRGLDTLARDAEGELSARCDLHERLGRTLASMCRWAPAREQFDAALAILPPASDLRRANLLLQNALCQHWTMGIDLLRATSEEALRLAEAAGDRPLMAAASGFLAQARHLDAELEEGCERYEAARAIAAPQSDPLVAQSQQQYPLNLHWVGRFERAVERGRELAAVARSNSDAGLLMCVLPATGMALGCAGRYREAHAVLEEAVRFGKEHRIEKLTARAMAMSVLGPLDVGDLPRARELSDRALDWARESEFPPSYISARVDGLLVAIAAGEIGRAQEMIEPVGAEIAEFAGWHEWVWRMRHHHARARLLLSTQDWDGALTAAADVLRQARAAGRTKYVIAGLQARAAALRGRGDDREAIDELRQAYTLAETIDYPALFVRVAADLLELDGDDAVQARAGRAVAAICAELDGLDGGQPRRRFEASAAVECIARGGR